MIVSGRSSFESTLRGFSLIEVILSLALVASAIVTFMALIPVGLKSSRDATDSIVMGHILEDAHERLEGHILKDGTPDSAPFYYDNEGVFVAPVDSKGESPGGGSGKTDPEELSEDASLLTRVYRVDLRLGPSP